jgi:hypothetical protein
MYAPSLANARALSPQKSPASKAFAQQTIIKQKASSEIQDCCFPFVLTAPLHSCSAVQAEPCRATCANATLELNQHSDLRQKLTHSRHQKLNPNC